MTSGMKTGKLERHFSEAFGLLDLHQQIVQDYRILNIEIDVDL